MERLLSPYDLWCIPDVLQSHAPFLLSTCLHYCYPHLSDAPGARGPACQSGWQPESADQETSWTAETHFLKPIPTAQAAHQCPACVAKEWKPRSLSNPRLCNSASFGVQLPARRNEPGSTQLPHFSPGIATLARITLFSRHCHACPYNTFLQALPR